MEAFQLDDVIRLLVGHEAEAESRGPLSCSVQPPRAFFSVVVVSESLSVVSGFETKTGLLTVPSLFPRPPLCYS